VPDHSINERVAIAENNIEHIKTDVDAIAQLNRETADRHDEKFEEILTIVRSTNAELTRYKIVSGTAVMILGGLLAGANYLMGVFGVSIADIWSKK